MQPRSVGSDWRPRALLTLLCLTLYLPGIAAIPPVDRDEARFAQASKQMLETGDFLLPHFQADGRFKKPIGIYWLQAAAVRLMGQQGRAAIWAYRLPSVLGAITAVLLTHWVGRQLFPRRVALLGAALLASSVLLIVEAHLATTDAVLLACVVAAQGCLAALYAADRRSRAPATYAAGFWVAQGLGILVKGPVVPLVSALTLGTLRVLGGRVLGIHARRDGWLAPLHCAWGLPLMLALVLPWMLAVGAATDWVYYRDWLGGDLLPKVVGGHESHGAPPGLYLLLAAATFWPGSFASALGVLQALQRRTRVAEGFCLAWLIPTWIFFEVLPTKLPHYVLPAYPALALLTARAVLAAPSMLANTRGVRAAFAGWGILTCFVGIAALFVPRLLGGHFAPAGLVVAILLVVVGVAVGRSSFTGRLAQAAWVGVAGAVAVFLPSLHWWLPSLNDVWLSRTAAAAIREQPRRSAGSRALAAVGYHEPSLVFLTNTPVALVEALAAARLLKEQPDALVLISDDQQAAFANAATEVGVHPRELWTTEGINYSKGRRLRLRLFDQRGSATDGAR